MIIVNNDCPGGIFGFSDLSIDLGSSSASTVSYLCDTVSLPRFANL